jgi:hypothetical protein
MFSETVPLIKCGLRSSEIVTDETADNNICRFNEECHYVLPYLKKTVSRDIA